MISSSETDPLQTPANNDDNSGTKRKDTNATTTTTSSGFSRTTTSLVGIIFVVIAISVFVKSVDIHNNSNVSGDPPFQLLGSSLKKRQHSSTTPKPTDQIKSFLYAWRDGRCDDLESLVVAPTKKRRHHNHHHSSFEFHVTAFGGDENDDGEDEEFVFNLNEFIELLCLPYKGQFEINFEDDNQHQNLGRTFGSIRAIGSDYYVNEDNVPCLAPYHASFVVELDMEDGRIISLREIVHNVEMYNMYTTECLHRGFTLDYYASEGGNKISSPKHRVLSSSQHEANEQNPKDLLSSESSLPSPPQSNIEKVMKFMDLYCTGYCDGAAEYLDESFTFQESYLSPTPILDRDAYVEMCRHDFLTEPEIFISLIEVKDGSTVTMTGQGFQMIAAQKSTSEGGRPCPIFAKESFFMNFTSDGKMSSMYVALEDTYFKDYMACQE